MNNGDQGVSALLLRDLLKSQSISSEGHISGCGINHSLEEVIVNFFRNPFKDEEAVRHLEVTMLRAFVVFDIAQKLVVLTITELHDAGRKIGWW